MLSRKKLNMAMYMGQGRIIIKLRKKAVNQNQDVTQETGVGRPETGEGRRSDVREVNGQKSEVLVLCCTWYLVLSTFPPITDFGLTDSPPPVN